MNFDKVAFKRDAHREATPVRLCKETPEAGTHPRKRMGFQVLQRLTFMCRPRRLYPGQQQNRHVFRVDRRC